MRQVPYGIVGDGRVATHMAHYFKLRGIPFRQWSRKISQEFCESLSDLLSDADTILVLISDSQIEPFIRENWHFFKHKRTVHFSGSLVTKLAEGIHPLMAFGPELYELEQYEKVPFIWERDQLSFSEVFPELRNPNFPIDPEVKSHYHSLCVLSNNFSTLLWQKFFKEMQARFKIPREHLTPFLKMTADNLIQNPDRALSGPIHRKDHQTVRSNLKALKNDRYEGIYRAFVEAHLPEYEAKTLH